MTKKEFGKLETYGLFALMVAYTIAGLLYDFGVIFDK